MALLEIEDLDVHYGGIHALKGVSLKVDAGEVVTLIGANGAGKTTTLRAISGLVPPSRGRVLFADAEIARAPTSESSLVNRLLRRFGARGDGLAPHQIVARGLVHAPEGRGIFSNMTVDENLEIGGFLRSDRDALAKDREQALSLFPRLKETPAHCPVASNRCSRSRGLSCRGRSSSYSTSRRSGSRRRSSR
jgi:branched-chain amino acid transport system ATP-binding protein